MAEPLLMLAVGLGVAVAVAARFVQRRSALRGLPTGISEQRPDAVGLLDGIRLRRVRSSLFEKRLRPAWQAAAGAHLTEIEAPGGPSPGLGGRSGRLRVQLDGDRDGGGAGARIVVTGFGHGVPGLLLRRRTSLGAGSGGGAVETGDAAFDGEIDVQGHAPLALAILDAETRPRLAELLRGQAAIAGQEPVEVSAALDTGVLEVRIEKRHLVARAEKLSDQLAGVLAGVLDVARRLVAPGDLAEHIASNLRREPDAGVRLQCARVLAELAEHPAARKALLAARQDPSDEVRLQAAVALGEAGRKTLLALIAGPATGDATAARAVAALGERLPAGTAEAALGRALETGRGETARACLDALGRFGGPASEGLLVSALQSEEPRIATAAARALGRTGTAAAIAALREAGSAWRPELRGAARQAIAEIQARLPGAGPGQLSLAGGATGALSLAQEAGGLSLSDEPERPAASREGSS